MGGLSIGKLFAAFTLIGFGVLLLLVNIGILTVEIRELLIFFYPVIFIAIGLSSLVRVMRKSGGSWFWGLLFLSLGMLLMLDRLDVISFTFGMVWKLWPLLLVYLGIKLFFNKGGIYENTDAGGFPIGDIKYDSPNWPVEPMNVWNAVGDYHLDFTKGFLPDKEIPIKISGWVGDVKILIPEELEFAVDAHVKAGSIKVLGQSTDGVNRDYNFKTPGYDEATRKLTFRVKLKAGDIRIDRV